MLTSRFLAFLEKAYKEDSKGFSYEEYVAASMASVIEYCLTDKAKAFTLCKERGYNYLLDNCSTAAEYMLKSIIEPLSTSSLDEALYYYISKTMDETPL